MTVLLLAVYLLAGVVHGIFDADVVGAPGDVAISLVDTTDESRKPDEGPAGSHHCHGCFSAAIFNPFAVSEPLEAKRRLIIAREFGRADSSTGIDPPPPKQLT